MLKRYRMLSLLFIVFVVLLTGCFNGAKSANTEIEDTLTLSDTISFDDISSILSMENKEVIERYKITNLDKKDGIDGERYYIPLFYCESLSLYLCFDGSPDDLIDDIASREEETPYSIIPLEGTNVVFDETFSFCIGDDIKKFKDIYGEGEFEQYLNLKGDKEKYHFKFCMDDIKVQFSSYDENFGYYSVSFSKNIVNTQNESEMNPNNASTYVEYMKRLDYLDEIEGKMLRATTTKEMIKTRETALYYWDMELNKIYKLLKEKLITDEMEELKVIQQKWIKDRDEEANRVLSLGGSAANVDYTDTLFSLTKQRTWELIYIYFNYDREKNFTNLPVETHLYQLNDISWTYMVAIMNDDNKTIYLFEETSNIPQIVSLDEEFVVDVDFMDVNLDGYLDLVVNTGGTMNETHAFYTWSFTSNNFERVQVVGSEMLSFFEVCDGYIKNFIRGSSPEDSLMEILIWNGNSLIKEYKEEDVSIEETVSQVEKKSIPQTMLEEKYDEQYYMKLSYEFPQYQDYFDNIIEYTSASNDSTLLIWSDKTIKSVELVNLKHGENAESIRFEEVGTEYKYENLLPGEVCVIHLWIPEGIPTQKIVLTDETGKTFSFTPRISGVDSSLFINPMN